MGGIQSQWKALLTVMPLDESKPMRVTPIMYMTNEDGNFDSVKLNENNNKVDGLKVIRLRGKSYYEQFEFA